MKKRSQRKPTARNNNAGVVRIIGGDFRGRKLPVLDAEGLRPTSDRVRETLFNWLQFDIAGANCLDLFSGSGALGFEAISRGAASLTMLELNKENARQLSVNLKTLGIENVHLHQADSLVWLQQQADQAYDVIFIDPPFHQQMVQPVIDLLFANGYVNDNTRLYIEQEKALDWPLMPDNWHFHKEKVTSQVRFALFIKTDA